MIKIPTGDKNILHRLYQKFSVNGFTLYLVGGALRDIIMEKTPHDYDLATDATPAQMLKIFPRALKTGIKHGTLTIREGGILFETTTMRQDGTYSDGRHPNKITFGHDIEGDLSRRDFTMNAIALDLKNYKIIDPFNGLGAIKSRVIRAVGDPKKRFLEDGLRPIRALRFMVQLGFTLDDATKSAIYDNDVIEKIQRVSKERFRDELFKILSSANPTNAIQLLVSANIMGIFLDTKISETDIKRMQLIDMADPLIRLAALLYGDENPYNTCHTLKMANADSKLIAKLISDTKSIDKWEAFSDNVISDNAVRKFLSMTGVSDYDKTITLWHAVRGVNNTFSAVFFNKLQESCKEQIAKGYCLSIADLAINGDDLKQLGLNGRDIGGALEKLLDVVLKYPTFNTKEKLLGLLAPNSV